MLNHIVMMGRLTKDPELRQAGDTPVCSFRIACDRDYKNKAGETETDFLDVVVWRKPPRGVFFWRFRPPRAGGAAKNPPGGPPPPPPPRRKKQEKGTGQLP